MAEPTGLIQIIKSPAEASAGERPSARPSAVEWPAVGERMREYAARRARPSAVEVCELCGAAIDNEHGHLVNVASRSMLCACRPCYLLFTHAGAGGARFRAVPQRYLEVPELASATGAWESLNVP